MPNFLNKGTVYYYLNEFAKTFFPNKNEKKLYSLFKVLFSLFLVFCIAFTCFTASYFRAEDKHKENDSRIYREFFEGQISYAKRLENLKKTNTDTEYWLHANFGAEGPVVLSDSDYYKNHGIDGKKSRYGVLYADKNAGKGENLVIYGNNNVDGTLFGNLEDLRTVSGFKASPIVELISKDGNKPFIIFSVMLLADNKKDDNGKSFDYKKGKFKSFAEFSKWSMEAEERSIIDTKIKPHYEDKVICLVTDAPDFKGAKLVVMAAEMNKDTDIRRIDDAVAKRDTRYPKIWYDKNGYDYPSNY